MVEFSVVLIAKQKHDWDSKATDNKDRPKSLSRREAFKDVDVRSKINEINEANEANGDDSIDVNLTPNQILDYLTISKNMPHYRKTDIIALILFNTFYIIFNIIYFVICIFT